ncbi:phosphonates metabolism transcriptional regulator PhnF [Pseudodesulfovibrio mercurii]|uniref:Phosphonates metabolism transcriptional regulator PhnF n=1 Tax=Pseudodesulfovibrio mercurii TaxID=641491 RepID=F0JCX1_9BACT|nr:phosphonate metabolism transcriptional regulator PhnF [Pseudodesulfovibrio mercurii]EGB13299.1 phosphonates metabolism transcriptional regulator PhnF [Pseudodesulfovibrio mercurii]
MSGLHYPADDADRRFSLDRNLRSPLWRQIAAALEREILRGRFLRGDQLPAESTLAKWYGVNRHTVRRALSHLQERDLVRSEKGRGTFVSEHVVEYMVSRRTRFSDNLNRLNRSHGGVLIGHAVVEAGEAVSRALQIRPEAQVSRLEILREAEGRPLSLTTHYFPRPRFAGIHETFRETGSITRCLDAHGVADYFREETRILTRQPTTEEARLLGLTRHRPVLETKSVNVDELGVPVDFGITRYGGDKIELVIKTFLD